ncbi:MAG TPA: hydrogenase expression/formation C-terminal domain-containing protein [Steroidobacteraceae bacterium]|nr:hydrogenase expression/formation C-terminal domain-containing protein [Steroidobacteraceae bacterium]
MTEHVLTWHPKVPGDSSAAGDGEPRLIGMPTGLLRPSRQALAADQLTPASRSVMNEVLEDLRSRAGSENMPPRRIDLAGLDEAGKAAVADMLGEGDVWAKVGLDDTYLRIVESVLPGVWRLEASTADGTTGEWLEVGAVPEPILRAAAELPAASIAIPGQMPQGAMNAPYLLAELQDRSINYQGGAENHVINFTLLPLTDVDAQVLTSVLGQIPLVIRSGGYGSTRVFATGLRHVWAVQYINGMGSVILDTLEVGGVPVAVLAAREDFEDSAGRLAEILEAFSS